MKLGLQYRHRLQVSGPGRASMEEFQSLMGALASWGNVEHHDDGTHGDMTADSVTVTAVRKAALEIESGWLDAGAGLAYSGAISPPILMGDVDNYSPVGIEEAFQVRLTSAAPMVIGGIQDGPRSIPLDGRVLALFNAGSNNIILSHENPGSEPNFRMRLPGTVNTNLPPNNFALLYYDAISRRWTMMSSSSGTGGSNTSEYGAGDTGAAITIDWANGTQQIATLTNNANISLINPVAGQLYRLYLIEGGGGGFTPSFVSPTTFFENSTLKPSSIAVGQILQVSLVYTNFFGGMYFAAYTPYETSLSVSNADLSNMAQSTIKGRAAGAGTGAPQDLTATQATAILNDFVGDSGSGGTKGLVPAPSSGDAAAGKYVSADGTFSVPIRTLISQDGSVPGGNTVANTVTETAFGSTFTIPANDLAVGDVLRVTLRGVVSTDVAAPTLKLKAYAGAVNLLDTTAVTQAASLSNGGWVMSFDVIVTAIGVSGKFEVQGEWMVPSTATVGIISAVPTTAKATVDTTGSNALTVKVTWGTANAANTITLRQWLVERLRA